METQDLNMDLMTPYKRRQLERDIAILNDYTELMAKPGAMATRVRAVLMEKYNIASMATITVICNRTRKRLGQAQASNSEKL